MDQTAIDPHGLSGGFRDLVGYRLLRWEEGYAEVGLLLEAHHRNRTGVLHGGVLATLIDAACGYAGTWCSVPANARRAFTLSLTSQFIAAGQIGERILAKATRTGGGRTIYFSSAEVFGEDGRLIGRGDGTFRLKRGSETLEGAPA
ncbi:MAG: PaaI family thioesterase [Tistlia sp.]|uniref:PaaI family thioesterase n=1 Tax=Tistlia sp. TaxID=3057121 RepID=UPI0034A4EE96